MISKQTAVISVRRDYDSHYQRLAIVFGRLKSISLGADNGKQPEISKSQFYQAFADAMAPRLLSESDIELVKLLIEPLNVSTFPGDMSPEVG